MNKKTIFQRILWIVISVLIMIFIYSMSAQNNVVTAAASGGLTKWIVDVFFRAWKLYVESEYLKAVYALHFLIRKAAHFGIFMFLGISVLQVLRTFKLKWIFRILITLGICLLYAMTDEFHQLFVVGRSGLVFDVIVDFAGSLLGMFVSVAISLLISQRIKEKQEEKAEKAA